MQHNTTSVANTYYAAFEGTHSVDEVPMHNDLTFVSPRFTLTDADAFRSALTALFKSVKSLHINDQIFQGETVSTFYDLDLGAPGGPISMAERLRVENGALTSVTLIFDSARLPSPPSSEQANPEA
ncbi:MAG: hypothetical protein NXH95_08115 [Pseudomonadaceae bacterium]|nr:hypothetical protein [Pseudomonadaceae bacterium]